MVEVEVVNNAWLVFIISLSQHQSMVQVIHQFGKHWPPYQSLGKHARERQIMLSKSDILILDTSKIIYSRRKWWGGNWTIGFGKHFLWFRTSAIEV